MTERIEVHQLNLSTDDPFEICFTCPRCEKEQFRYVMPGDIVHCSNPDCKPDGRNMSFEIKLSIESGTYQSRLDVPVQCQYCGADYEHFRNGLTDDDGTPLFDFVSPCNCETEIPF